MGVMGPCGQADVHALNDADMVFNGQPIKVLRSAAAL